MFRLNTFSQVIVLSSYFLLAVNTKALSKNAVEVPQLYSKILLNSYAVGAEEILQQHTNQYGQAYNSLHFIVPLEANKQQRFYGYNYPKPTRGYYDSRNQFPSILQQDSPYWRLAPTTPQSAQFLTHHYPTKLLAGQFVQSQNARPNNESSSRAINETATRSFPPIVNTKKSEKRIITPDSSLYVNVSEEPTIEGIEPRH